MNTKHLTIMFTDMKGFTERTAGHSRRQLDHLLELQDDLIKPAIRQFDGTIVKTIGDAFLVAFESPTDAVLCGMKIQENMINHNARAASSDQFDIRIAINSGEVNVRDNDIFGEAVNITSRIESIAEPNEVYFTEAVYLAMNRNEIPTAEVGYRRLKGIPEEIKIYKVLSERTNLIRMKMRRQEMAKNNANLVKDEVYAGAKDIFSAPVVAAKEPEPKKTFWQKHKKKIIIVGVVFILFLILVNANKQKNKEVEPIPAPENNTASRFPILEIRNKMSSVRNDFEKALKNNDKNLINSSIDKLDNFSKLDLPPELKKMEIEYIKGKINNPSLNLLQQRRLKEILNNLEQ